MTEQNQIEEMAKEDRINKLAKELCHAMYCHIKDEPTECYHGCKAYIYAKRAIEAGYRKQIVGEWNNEGTASTTGGFNWYSHGCSNCSYHYKNTAPFGYDYCPNCGARMKGDEGK